MSGQYNNCRSGKQTEVNNKCCKGKKNDHNDNSGNDSSFSWYKESYNPKLVTDYTGEYYDDTKCEKIDQCYSSTCLSGQCSFEEECSCETEVYKKKELSSCSISDSDDSDVCDKDRSYYNELCYSDNEEFPRVEFSQKKDRVYKGCSKWRALGITYASKLQDESHKSECDSVSDACSTKDESFQSKCSSDSDKPKKTRGYHFQVSISDKKGHPYEESNKCNTCFVIDGCKGKTLNLKRGNTYYFTLTQDMNFDKTYTHHLYFTEDSIGGPCNKLKGSPDMIGEGTVCLKLDDSYPDQFYYQSMDCCYAGGKIIVHN
jgi:hypothetical protein